MIDTRANLKRIHDINVALAQLYSPLLVISHTEIVKALGAVEETLRGLHEEVVELQEKQGSGK